MSKHLVLAGAGHAHMVAMAGIAEILRLGHRVTVIGPSEFHYYSGMGPGMLGRGYDADEIRFAVKRTVERQGAEFLLDTVSGIRPEARELQLLSGRIIAYDVLSLNTGSQVTLPEISGDSSCIYPVKPIEGLLRARTEIESLARKQALTVVVVGGGPAAVEVAGNVAHLLRGAVNSASVILHAGQGLLTKFPDSVRKTSAAILKKNGVILKEEGYLQSIHNMHLHFTSGAIEDADFVFLATGVHPSGFIRGAGLPVGADGGLLVNRFLQCTAFPEIFGGGDCISFAEQPLDKVGVYAVRENPVLFHNIKASLQGEALQSFDPGGGYLLIFNLGNGLGVLRKGWLQISGRLAFRVKDWIDKKFMARFK
jgi:NADH dehydrogenase FAD-containing subunit